MGLKGAKSVRRTQDQEVTSRFSSLMSPWNTDRPCACSEREREIYYVKFFVDN